MKSDQSFKKGQSSNCAATYNVELRQLSLFHGYYLTCSTSLKYFYLKKIEIHFISVYHIRPLALKSATECGAEVIAIIIYSLVINLETACGETKIERNLA
jgi:hypothetical protein